MIVIYNIFIWQLLLREKVEIIYLYITDLERSLKDWLRYNEIQDKSLVSKYKYS